MFFNNLLMMSIRTLTTRPPQSMALVVCQKSAQISNEQFGLNLIHMRRPWHSIKVR